MKRICSLILFLLLFCFASGWADENIPESRLSLTASYFGEMVLHPGFKAGIEYRIMEGKKASLSVPLAAGWYRHIRNHQMLSVESGLVGRLSSKGPFFSDLLLGAGYGLKKPDGSIYFEDEEGSILTESASWTSRFLVTAALGAGFDFGKNARVKLSPFLRLGFFGEYPYNTYMLLHPFLESGIRVRLPKAHKR